MYRKLQTCLKLVFSLQTGRRMHVATITGPLHSIRSHSRVPIFLQEELQYRNKLNQNDQWYIVGIWEPKHYINSNSEPIGCIWHSRSWCLTNGTSRSFWIPKYSTQNNLHPRYFKVVIEDKYSKPKELTFSVPQGSCSSAKLFSCYCSLLHDQINNSITPNGSTDDHSICKIFKAGNKDQDQQTKTDTEEAFKQIKILDILNIFFLDPKHNSRRYHHNHSMPMAILLK